MFIFSKFKGLCKQTGATIERGERVWWDKSAKAVYASSSHRFKEEVTRSEDPADPSLAKFVQDQEDAYFDNFCQRNNI